MTLDQKIQVWVAIGTWVAGLATLAAVVVALYLARRSERVRLRVAAGLRDVVIGDGTPIQTHLSIDVTNLGERSVTINSVGWAIGKWKERRYCVQPVYRPFTTQCPVELAHGKAARFMVSFLVVPNWLHEFATGFVQDLSERSLKTLVVLVQTSVGDLVEVRPEPGLLKRLRESVGPG